MMVVSLGSAAYDGGMPEPLSSPPVGSLPRMSLPRMSPPLEPLPLAEPDTGGSTLVEDRPVTSTGDGDHERFAHYVKKDRIVESAVLGSAVTALCGKKWIPGRDPNKFPVCPDCKKIYDGIPGGKGGKGGKGDDSGGSDS